MTEHEITQPPAALAALMRELAGHLQAEARYGRGIRADTLRLCANRILAVLVTAAPAAQKPSVTAPAPGQADPIAVTANGGTMLSCFREDPASESGDLIRLLEPGDRWVDIVAKVHEHQAEHGCGPQPQPAPEIPAAGPQAALDRVRELARSWATLGASPGGDAQMAAEAGRRLLDVIHGDPGSAGERLRLVARMAEDWRTPGASLFYPVAGQRVLNAIGDDAQPQPTSELDALHRLIRDMLGTMAPSPQALGFAVRAGQLGVTDAEGRTLAPACGLDGVLDPGGPHG
jgi:hypothetical protein